MSKVSEQLEKEANELLYGDRKQARRSKGFQYQLPTTNGGTCEKCGRRRAMLSARVCRACYRRIAAKKQEKIDRFEAEYYTEMHNFGIEGDGDSVRRIRTVKE